MDQLRYNEEKARLSYVYANHTALQRLCEARPYVNVENGRQAAEHAVLATSAFLASGPSGNWHTLAVAVGLTIVGHEVEHGYEPDGATGLRMLAECPNALKAYGELCLRGERKYTRGNYRLGSPITHYCDSGLRHLNAILRGTAIDPELDVPHGICAFWNLWQALDQPDWRDDRLPAVQARHTIADVYASPARMPEGVIYAN